MFLVSQLVNLLMPALRAAAGLGSCEIIATNLGTSAGAAAGIMLNLPSLEAVQGRRFDTPHVIFSDALTGFEDIPANVSAVLTSSTVDVLAHVAIRAREQGVLLASCNNPAKAGSTLKYSGYDGQMVAVSMDAAGEVGQEGQRMDLKHVPV